LQREIGFDRIAMDAYIEALHRGNYSMHPPAQARALFEHHVNRRSTMDRLEAFRSIAAQASRGDLSFPSTVGATLRLKQALDDPDAHLANAAKLVQADPLLAARTVALANSVAYNRSGNEVNNVTTAVMRLGFGALRSLTAAMMVRQLSGHVSSPSTQEKAVQLWRHTANVAALARVIARRMSKVDPETAMFAGIVHEVGGFYLLSRADEFPGLLDGALEDWVEYGEKIIGRGVLKALEIPATICAAVEQVWQGHGAQPPASLGDVLALANALAAELSPLQPPSAVALHEGDASVDFAVGDTYLSVIVEEASEEIESLNAALLA
jgi:HD-like signal output (HDOD) protein